MTTKIYLVGHGFVFSASMPPKYVPIPIQIPNGISVTFYVKVFALFDSAWEKPIVNGAAGAKICPIEKAKADWAVERRENQCAEHLLTRPGNMRPNKGLDAMKKITPDAGGATVNIDWPLQDGDTLYIDDSDRDHCTCRLSAILNFLNAKGFTGEVHWLACREMCVEPNVSLVAKNYMDSIVAQAQEAIDTVARQPVLPSKPKQPPKQQAAPASPLSYADKWPSDYPSIADRGVT